MWPLQVNMPHFVTYWVVLPIQVTVGILANSLSVAVLRRPALRSQQVNRYFQLLGWSDILLFLSHLPIIISINGCIFSSYGLAWYFAHMGWTVIAGVHSFSSYILAWLALDRCLAVWWHSGYSFMQRIRVQHFRIIITALACMIVQIPYMVEASVTCVTSSGEKSDAETDPYCLNGTWGELDGHQKNFGEMWHVVYGWFYGFMMRGGPGVLLLVFNLSLVVAVCQGRVHSRTRPKPQQELKNSSNWTWERNLMITMIAMASSHLALALPIVVFLVFYAENDPEHCIRDNAAETLRHTANCMLLLEHIMHPVFLACLNPVFRRELSLLLRLTKARDRPVSGIPSMGLSDTSTNLVSLASTSSQNNTTPLSAHKTGHQIQNPPLIQPNTTNLTEQYQGETN